MIFSLIENGELGIDNYDYRQIMENFLSLIHI